MAGDWRVVPCAELAAPALREAAELAFVAHEAFYGLAPLPRPAMLDVLAEEIASAGCELSLAQAILADGAVAGLFAAYPVAELKGRQGASLHHLASALPPDGLMDFLRKVRAFAADMPEIAGDGLYLARFAAAERWRGTGLADALFKAAAGQDPLWLHVRADNTRAIGFYERHGMRFQGEQGGSYRVMAKGTTA